MTTEEMKIIELMNLVDKVVEKCKEIHDPPSLALEATILLWISCMRKGTLSEYLKGAKELAKKMKEIPAKIIFDPETGEIHHIQ